LSAHVPHVELDVFVCYCFDVEADGGNGSDILVEFELVEDCWEQGLAVVHEQRLGEIEPAMLADVEHGSIPPHCPRVAPVGSNSLVLPAASRPNISRRISFDPKILPIIFDI
jgi:hypothetical protein